jgi:NitT/TauT family transport system substrate-binding protein
MISRRRFLEGISASALGVSTVRAEDARAPETTSVRIIYTDAVCSAPQFVAGDLLAAEGFTDVEYVNVRFTEIAKVIAAGDRDFGMLTILPTVMRLDAGDPLVIMAGIHVGCYELVGTDRVRSIHDLKGKIVAIGHAGGGDHAYIAIMAAYVGLDPRKDIHWVMHSPDESKRLLAEGKIDAYMAFAPDTQDLRAKKLGRVIVSTTVDRPWSQYFCCMALGNREFVRKNPVATKRVLRAILKGADLCALQPDRAARFVTDKRYTRPDYALQVLKELPYGKWREYDPADTVRFAALRLHEVGMIKSSPQKIMAQGTDWRFLNELNKELKG